MLFRPPEQAKRTVVIRRLFRPVPEDQTCDARASHPGGADICIRPPGESEAWAPDIEGDDDMNSSGTKLVMMSGALRALVLAAVLLCSPSSSRADHTPVPTSVTIAGSMQSEAGCPADWQPDCVFTHLAFDGTDGVWQGTWALPAGSWEYKAALNDSWTENYGLHGIANGPNVPMSLSTARSVKFYYDHSTHWITDNATSRIVTAPGSYQSELGCPGDWQPECLRSWLEDVDGDGIFTRTVTGLTAGFYEVKAALFESWDENYGAGGIPNGPNIGFTVMSELDTVDFSYDDATHVLTVTVHTTTPVLVRSWGQLKATYR